MGYDTKCRNVRVWNAMFLYKAITGVFISWIFVLYFFLPMRYNTTPDIYNFFTR